MNIVLYTSDEDISKRINAAFSQKWQNVETIEGFGDAIQLAAVYPTDLVIVEDRLIFSRENKFRELLEKTNQYALPGLMLLKTRPFLHINYDVFDMVLTAAEHPEVINAAASALYRRKLGVYKDECSFLSEEGDKMTLSLRFNQVRFNDKPVKLTPKEYAVVKDLLLFPTLNLRLISERLLFTNDHPSDDYVNVVSSFFMKVRRKIAGESETSSGFFPRASQGGMRVNKQIIP